MTKLPLLPRLDPDQNSGSPLATSRWQPSQSVMSALCWTENDPEADSPILLGQLHDENGKRHFMGFDDDSGVVLAYGNSDITTTKYLSSRLGLSELNRITIQSNQQTGSNQSDLTLGQALKAVGDIKDFTLGLGQLGKSTSSGTSVSGSEQLHKTDLMTPDEVSRFFSRESGAVLALIAGALPVRLERLAAHTDPFFTERAHKNPFHSK